MTDRNRREISPSAPCDVSSAVRTSADASPASGRTPPRDLPIRRRGFLKGLAATTAGLTCGDFLSHFLRFGLTPGGRAAAMAADAAVRADSQRFLVYWFLEGGWLGYDMFNPVWTVNSLHHRLENISAERYRVLRFGEDGYRLSKHGAIEHGYLADDGRDLFSDIAVLSSMQTGSSHSRERLHAHMGTYKFRPQAEREDDERSVMQAFAEAYGQPYALPNLSWHWWLSDGELNEVQYTGRRGYYHALGPVHAHTIYAGPPSRLKRFLGKMLATSGDAASRAVQDFLEGAQTAVLKDENIEAVKSYNSARRIYLQLVAKGMRLDPEATAHLFEDPQLRQEFDVKPTDELLTYRSVNGNKARTKFCPNTNVQAMMAYELMRAKLSCAFWIESRDVRRYDSHRSRSRLWNRNSPVGQTDQTEMMHEDLWDPLRSFVRRLKATPLDDSGESLYDRTTIVVTSEFGRTIHGNVDELFKGNIAASERQEKIDGQDICQHWKVTSAFFLGGNVRGNTQYGGVGERTLLSIPILPDGRLDPAFDSRTGEIIPGRRKSARSFIPDHGSVYATALSLAGLNPKGRGRNERPPLRFIHRNAPRWL